MVNLNIRENKVEQVSRRHFCQFKDLNISSKELQRSLKLKSISYLKNKTMNHGKYKTLHLLKSFIRLEIIMKKLSISCYHKEHNKSKNYWTRVNILSSNYSMRLEGSSCLTISQVGKISLKQVSNMPITRVRISRNGLNLFDIIAILIMLEKKRMNNTGKNNTQEKNQIGKCLLII